MKTSESKKQVNTYAIYDCMGRLTDVRYYASNKAGAMKLFKADTVNYRKYGYFGKLSRIYDFGKQTDIYLNNKKYSYEDNKRHLQG